MSLARPCRTSATFSNNPAVRMTGVKAVTMSDAPTQTLAPAHGAPAWAGLVATFFGAGRLRPGPGTWGSAAAVLIWAGVGHWTPAQYQWIVLAGLVVFATLIGIPAATLYARASGQKDPQSVVIDEVAGQWITLLF